MKYITLLFLILIISCKNTDNRPKATFTIKGRVLNGTTGKAFANQSISAMEHTLTKTPYAEADLGSTTTDSGGNFTLKYTQPAIKYGPDEIMLQTNNFQLDGIAANKNIDSTFYLSSFGSIKIYLQTQTPLINDTLFIGYALLDNGGGVAGIKIDTILKTVNGYFQTIRYPPSGIGIYYARGWSNFGYDPSSQVFRGNNSKEITFKISGDPYVDIGTINY